MTDEFMATLTLPLRLRNHKVREQKYSPFFEVKDIPIIFDDFNFKERYLINGETNKKVGLVSGHYKVTTHKEASDFVKGILEKAGMDYQSQGARTSSGGSRFFENIVFPSLAFNPAKETASTALDGMGMRVDDHYPRITITNSYDKTKPLEFRYGMYRLRCTNGMSLPLKETKVSFRHNQKVDYDWVKDNLISNLENSQALMQRVFEKLNGENGLEYLCRIMIDGSGFSNNFRVALKDKLNAQDGTFHIDYEEETDPKTGVATKMKIKSITTKQTAYAIYNLVTDISSHNITNAYLQEVTNKRIASLFIGTDKRN